MLWCSINVSSFGGKVITADVREYGKTEVDLNKDSIIFKGI